MSSAVGSPSPFDIRWRMLGINFQIHSSFWLTCLIFGYLVFGYQPTPPWTKNPFLCLACWTFAVLVSVIVHELGHSLTAMLFGQGGNVIVYSMGGAAVGMYEFLATWKRLLVVAGGPAASIAFWALTRFVLYPYADRESRVMDENISRWILLVLQILDFFNLIMCIFNLLPVLPLDGGHLMKDAFMLVTPTYGMRIGYALSFCVALGVTLYSGLKIAYRGLPYPPLDPFFNLIFFAMFAWQNFNVLRSLPWGQRHRQFEEDPW